MKIFIKGTKKMESISLIENGVDCSQDVICNVTDCWNSETDRFEMNQEDFDWWKEYFNNLQSDKEDISEIALDLDVDESEIYEEISKKLAYSTDLNDEHAIKQDIIQEFKGKSNK